MNICVIGDTHGNPLWEKIVEKELDTSDFIIFLGDYFDSYVHSTIEQIHNFLKIIEFKKKNNDKIILLIGNHDWEYFPEKQDKGNISGYQMGDKAMNISFILNKEREHLQAAFSHENLLFTHAGVSLTWLELAAEHSPIELPEYTAKSMADFINLVFEFKPNLFNFISGEDPYGNNTFQSPFWVRPQALMKGAVDYKKNIVQIVGHTAQRQIDIKGKATGKRYFFIDTITTNKEYLYIKNKDFQSRKIY